MAAHESASRGFEPEIARPHVLRRAAFRLIPFLAVLYFISYLDRVNIAFAAIEMNAALNLTSSQYGAGAGIFFLGYLAFQIPSNLMLQRVGARRWLTVIIFAWGIASLLMSFIRDSTQFYLVRFALGAAEAGFFPGLVLYLTYWFTPNFRGRIMSGLLLSVPLATVLGAPASNAILVTFDGTAGMQAWQWLFLMESIPALLAAVLVWIVLPEGPAEVRWLTTDEKQWLASQLPPAARQDTRLGAAKALTELRIILLATAYLGLGLGLYGIGFWVPQIIKSSGASGSAAVLLTAIPYLVAAVAMAAWGRVSDRNPVAPSNCWIPMLMSAIALGILPIATGLAYQIILLSIAAAGILSAIAVFWTLPTVSTSPQSLGVVIAFINTAGGLGGFIGPFAVGWLKDVTGTFAAGVDFLAFATLGAAMLLMLPRARSNAFIVS